MAYFRITGYHKEKDICFIADSNGAFEKLWQFSAFLIQKGITVIEASNDGKFLEGSLPLIKPSDKIMLRACDQGEPIIIENTITVHTQEYFKEN